MHFTGQPGERQELHVRDEVELAAALAVNSVAGAASATRLSATGLRQYWTVAKLRLDRWNRFLRGAGSRRTPSEGVPTSHGANTRAWFEEILVGEVLTRVWAANVIAHHHGVSDGSGREADLPCSIVRRVVESHTQVRHQALQLLAGQEGHLPLGLSPDEAAGVDRLRRSIARWIDLLVAHVHENAQQASVAKLPTTAQATNHDTGIDVCPLAIDP
ncbi:MAG: hypothetical protein K8T25_15545, partial [Planctomycetia bacterium]|nr:hypothetical protein [Planctomycetia bacterium]